MSLKAGRWRRATSTDAEYGLVCPSCAGPKTLQALRCAICYHLGTRTTSSHLRNGAAVGTSRRYRSESHLPAVKGR